MSTTLTNKTIGKMVSTARKKSGYSVYRTAALSGLSVGQITAIEAGANSTLTTLFPLFHALKIKMEIKFNQKTLKR
jgi:transcriptional regulator with XRE-family HTH domain